MNAMLNDDHWWTLSPGIGSNSVILSLKPARPFGYFYKKNYVLNEENAKEILCEISKKTPFLVVGVVKYCQRELLEGRAYLIYDIIEKSGREVLLGKGISICGC